jgi:DNA mismatch repair protein MutS2
MDDYTLTVLDFARVRQILADLSQTEMGRSRLLALQPLDGRERIEHEYALAEELLVMGEEPPLYLVKDVRAFLSAQEPRTMNHELMEYGNAPLLGPQDLLEIRAALEGLTEVHDYLKKHRSKLPKLTHEAAAVRSFEPLEQAIGRIVTETGEIRDSASPELNRLRSRLRRLRNELVRSLETIAAASPDVFQECSVSVRGGRFVLPLKAEARNRFDAILHDTSDSGHTLFVEPLQLLPEQNELARLRRAEQDEVRRILAAITQAVRAEADALTAALLGVARFDEICARKRFAAKFDAVRPIISERGVVNVIAGRHPLLQTKKQAVVPLVFALPDDTQVVLISGPNAGGKTVAMKTVGLFASMLAAGLFLPAAPGTELPLFSQIFAMIGDEQSLEGDLSSFSAHLLRTRQILGQADATSLVLLDEIGGSTSPEEGSALAIAVLEELQNRGALTIATSHLGPLKAFVQTAKGMANAAMEFKDRPTYRLLMGVPGESSALEIAEGLGFPHAVLSRARNYVNQEWLQLSERLKELTAERDEAQRLRAQLAHETNQAQALRQTWEQKLAQFRQFEAAERRKLQADQLALLRQTRREIENLVREIREHEASRETIVAAKSYVEERLRSAESVAPSQEPGTMNQERGNSPLAPGSTALSRLMGRVGTVVDIAEDEATVAFGSIRMRVKLADLDPVERPAPEPGPVAASSLALPDTEEFDPRLNVRGMTQDEARESLERFLDRAEMSGAHQISILHGKGTGVLRNMLWDRLRRDKRVGSIRLGEPGEGGSGITFVELKA